MNKIDLKSHLKIHRGYLTEEFICELSGIKKYSLIDIADKWIRKGLIECKKTVSVKITKDGSIHEIAECGYSLIDALILLSKYRKTPTIIHAIKLCKELLHD